jgi:hypothetical protein
MTSPDLSKTKTRQVGRLPDGFFRFCFQTLPPSIGVIVCGFGIRYISALYISAFGSATAATEGRVRNVPQYLAVFEFGW